MDGPKATYKDYYYVLGVKPDATSEEIRDAYSDLYERFGPHVNIAGQDPDSMLKAFRDISEAFDVLSDPDRRKQYDSENLPHLQKSHLRSIWGKFSGVDVSGQGMTTGQPTETRMDVEITLRESIKGTIAKLRIDDNLPCGICGKLKPVQRAQCTNCRGAGYTHNARIEELEIKPGTCGGEELRFAGLGKYDMRVGRAGDLFVTVKLRQHAFFALMGRDLTCTVPITITEAVLGGEIDIPTATGKVVMKIQPLTQSGRVYRLKGMGLAGADLLATMQVVVPTQISADEVELFRKLKVNSSQPNPRAEIFAKLAEQNPK